MMVLDLGRLRVHTAPDKDAIKQNVEREPDGERIRAELIDFLNRNKIVGIMLDTEEHTVSVDIVKLPPKIKPVLTRWGAIYVRDEEETPKVETPKIETLITYGGKKLRYFSSAALWRPYYFSASGGRCLYCKRDAPSFEAFESDVEYHESGCVMAWGIRTI